MTQYTIREQHFFYNDERYHIEKEWEGAFEIGALKQNFQKRQQAEAYCKQLNIQSARQTCLSDYEIFLENFDEINTLLQQYDPSFILDDINEDTRLPKMITDEQISDFIQKINLLPFILVEESDNKTVFALWLPTQNEYLRDRNDNVIFADSLETLIYLKDYEIIEKIEEWELSFQQAIHALTDSPHLLQQFIQQNPSIQNNDEGLYFSFNTLEFHQIQGLNALLKQPFFEIREIKTVELLNLNH